MKGMEKKGQFFLIAAGIIAVIVVGLATSVNYAITQPEPTVFYDLSKNFDKETMKVVDFGTFSPPPDAAKGLADFIENFTKYAQEKDPNIELVYLFGNNLNVAVFNSAKKAIYSCPKNEECTPVGGLEESKISLTIAEKLINRDVTQQNPQTGQFSGNEITIKIGDVEYTYYLPENNQFYFILRTEKNKEIYVVT